MHWIIIASFVLFSLPVPILNHRTLKTFSEMLKVKSPILILSIVFAVGWG